MDLSVAIALAAEGFRKRYDKGGQPYIMHCIRVMQKMDTDVEKIVAILHDTLEDGVCPFGQLNRLGFSDEVLNALHFLTHDKKACSYQEYIQKLSVNKIAVKVKMADLEDNSCITRLKGLRAKDLERIEKYHIAYTTLKALSV